jgi:hypothetical protein
MADTYTLADLLQGRNPNRSAPYTAPMSEFTTPEDLRRERISSALGWDVGRPWQEFAQRALPLALSAVRAPVAPRISPAAAPASPAAPQGPWEPGFMTQWLQGRYQPQVPSAALAGGSALGHCGAAPANQVGQSQSNLGSGNVRLPRPATTDAG